MVINLLLLLSSATLVPLFFLKSGTLFLGFFGIIYKWAVGTQDAFALPPLCLRSAFAPKVEAKGIQNGTKQPSISPIHLVDELKLTERKGGERND